MERDTHGTTALLPTLVRDHDDPIADLGMAVHGWLTDYPPTTRKNYASQLNQWLRWCNQHGLDALRTDRHHPRAVRRDHVALYMRQLDEQLGNMPSTIAHKWSTVHSFYSWCLLEEIVERDPTANVRRPKVRDQVMRPYLDRMESGRFLAFAEASSPRDYALITLLLLNGLRISEALDANIETISSERGHHTMVIKGKGSKIATIPLAPRTHRALLAYIGERESGPIFLGREGERMNRHAAARTIRRVARKAKIDKRLSPHSMRRSFITVALDSGVPLRDVQHGARHSDPRVTSRYDQNRVSLDTHPTYVLNGYMAGG
jgi:site-specific recombinase XerD